MVTKDDFLLRQEGPDDPSEFLKWLDMQYGHVMDRLDAWETDAIDQAPDDKVVVVDPDEIIAPFDHEKQTTARSVKPLFEHNHEDLLTHDMVRDAARYALRLRAPSDLGELQPPHDLPTSEFVRQAAQFLRRLMEWCDQTLSSAPDSTGAKGSSAPGRRTKSERDKLIKKLLTGKLRQLYEDLKYAARYGCAEERDNLYNTIFSPQRMANRLQEEHGGIWRRQDLDDSSVYKEKIKSFKKSGWITLPEGEKWPDENALEGFGERCRARKEARD